MDKIKDLKLISEAEKSITDKQETVINDTITNADRSLGAMLNGIIAEKYGEGRTSEDTIKINLRRLWGKALGIWNERYYY